MRPAAALARALPALAAVVLLAGAAPSRARAPGCAYCRMAIERADFGGEIRTADGRRRAYDAIECMAAAVLTDSVPPVTIRAMTVADRRAPHAAIPVARAVFVHADSLASPMGLGLAAYASRAAAAPAARALRGETLEWTGVLAHVNARWFQGRLDVLAHAATPPAR